LEEERVLRIIAVLLFVISSMVACSQPSGTAPTATRSGSGTAVPSPTQPLPLRLNIGATASHAAMMVAVQRGFFTDAGLNVTVVNLTAGGDVINAMLGGSLDAGQVPAAGLGPAWEQGAPLVALSVGYGGGDRFALVARSDGGITKPEDIVGKKIGVWLGTGSEQVFRAMLKVHKIKADALTVVPLQGPDMPAALAAKQVDGAFAIEPQISQMETAGTARVIVRGEQYAGGVNGFITFKQDFLNANGETVRRFVLAQARAMQFARKNPVETIEIVKKYLPSTTEASLKGLRFDPRITPSVIGGIVSDLDFLLTLGKIKKLPDLDKVVSGSAVDALLKDHPELFDDLPK
jgi:ABC-type nitrate/sulfonate/bicarbonate transport system substrate-binding protein